MGVFVYLLRTRFSAEHAGGKPLMWRWEPQLKPGNLAIESAFSEDKAHKNHRPQITVDVEATQADSQVLGDRQDESLRNQRETFYQHKNITILVEVIATKRGEAHIIGDLVQAFFQATTDLIQKHFGLQHMSPVTVGQAMPYTQETDVFKVPVRFMVIVPVAWSTRPHEAPMRTAFTTLAEIQAKSPLELTTFLERVAKGLPSKP